MALNDPIESNRKLNAQCRKEAKRDWNDRTPAARLSMMKEFNENDSDLFLGYNKKELKVLSKLKFKDLPLTLQNNLESDHWDNYYN